MRSVPDPRSVFEETPPADLLARLLAFLHRMQQARRVWLDTQERSDTVEGCFVQPSTTHQFLREDGQKVSHRAQLFNLALPCELLRLESCKDGLIRYWRRDTPPRSMVTLAC